MAETYRFAFKALFAPVATVFDEWVNVPFFGSFWNQSNAPRTYYVAPEPHQMQNLAMHIAMRR